MTQLRILGAVIGLSAVNTALSNYVTPQLSSILSPSDGQQLAESTAYIFQLSAEKSEQTRTVYNDGYNVQMKIVMGFSILSFFISMTAFRRKPLGLEHAGLGEGERDDAEDDTGTGK